MLTIADLIVYLWESPIPGVHFYQQSDDGTVHADYRGLQLTSVFQPIFCARSQQVLAHEGLLRARDEHGPLSPEAAFERTCRGEDFVTLDRSCRILHTLNFLAQNVPSRLYLNLHPQHVQTVSCDHGQVFDHILQRFGMASQRITLEVLESAISDFSHLENALHSYRQRGYRIAIDDFGREHSNFDRLWRLQPDEVKFDRSIIVAASDNLRVRRILPKLVDIVHELGATAICEGLETADQMALARDAGFDGLQGYHLQRPDPLCRRTPLWPAKVLAA